MAPHSRVPGLSNDDPPRRIRGLDQPLGIAGMDVCLPVSRKGGGGLHFTEGVCDDQLLLHRECENRSRPPDPARHSRSGQLAGLKVIEKLLAIVQCEFPRVGIRLEEPDQVIGDGAMVCSGVRFVVPTFRDRENAFSVDYFLGSTKARTPA